MSGILDRVAEALLASLQDLSPLTVIGLFALLLFGLFLAGLAATALRRAEAFQGAAPTLLTTLGILGTFLGVAIGLLDFDAGRVEASIPALLEGLKLAFVTSIVGILLAAVLRIVQVIAPAPAPVSATESSPTRAASGPSRDAELATQQRDATLAVGEAVRKLDQRLDARLEQQHRELTRTLDGMAERITEMSSGHLVEALERVIHDFNSRLGEQFGENFRRLDDSVARLVEWQEQYRQQMDGLHRAFDQARAGVEQTEQTLERMTGQALQITRHVEDQESTLSSLRRETVELEALLGSIAALRDRATEAFPAMDARLEAMLESIENAVQAGHAAEGRWGAERAAPAVSAGGRS
ncbi:hypothetical protein [Thioalkalivibrio sp. ALE31]|uniref:hypothetical protein n=1 Tax=Thioalkalivibrio sp. ALE31 TaxID=1158182 RepID=UPI00036DDD25|nr:hypothetical protein [Thioalkalivibrio sp. ALE31]